MKVIRTKRGDPMAFLTLSDETGEMEAVVFPDLYRDVNRFLKEEMIIFIVGKIESRNNTLQWLLSVIEPFTGKHVNTKQNTGKMRLFIRYPKKEHQANLQIIQSIATKYPGDSTIIVYHEDAKETYQLHQSYAMEA